MEGAVEFVDVDDGSAGFVSCVRVFYCTMSANCIPRRKCSDVWCAAYECRNAFEEETGSFVFQISKPAVAVSRVFLR